MRCKAFRLPRSNLDQDLLVVTRVKDSYCNSRFKPYCFLKYDGTKRAYEHMQNKSPHLLTNLDCCQRILTPHHTRYSLGPKPHNDRRSYTRRGPPMTRMLPLLTNSRRFLIQISIDFGPRSPCPSSNMLFSSAILH